MTKQTIALVVLALSLPITAQAGAWTQQKGKAQLITSAYAYTTDHYWDTAGKKRSQLPYYKQEASVYGEYGLRDGITLGGRASMVNVYQETVSRARQGFNIGDTELFVRKRLWQDGKSVFSLQPSLVIPSPDDKTDVPKIGADRPMAGLRAAYGRNFNAFGKSHYMDISAAYVHRMGAPADQLKLEATAGLNLSEKWQIIPQAFATKSTKKIRSGAATTFTQSSADNYDIATLQLTAQYALSAKTALQAGVQTNIAGRNTGAGYGVLFNYVRNF